MRLHDREEDRRMPPTAEGPQVTALARQAKGGNKRAFEQLVVLFQGEVFGMVYHRTSCPSDAEDLTQDVFLRAYRNLPRLKDPERFRSWLLRIASNRIWDFLRRKRFLAFFHPADGVPQPEVLEAEDGEGSEADSRMMREEFWEHIRAFCKGLSRWEREVFTLRFMEHLSTREIAEVVGKSESAVKTHLHRAVKKLQKEPGLLRFLREALP